MAGSVTLTGTARAGAAVDIYVKYSTGLSLLDSLTANSAGKFSSRVAVSRNTVFIAKTTTATSVPITVKVVSTVRISAKVLRNGRVRVGVSGGPLRNGTIRLYERFRGGKVVRIAIYRASRAVGSWDLKAGKGVHVYRATYTSPGANQSATVSLSIKR